ncbi:hypothetical protein [Fundidesulfovibrio soli]|uniref:hypothetical protein n=1 Tax=Fundidesulfovibrio soli TaxID=2922716 RepID=UPI001FB0059D|nr:hypothetical protein [Fundidesulfovibrio soli]
MRDNSLHDFRAQPCRNLWIVGGGGLGRVYFSYLKEIQQAAHTDVPVAGFLDNNVAQSPGPLLERLGEEAASVRVLPIDGFTPDSEDMFVCAMGKPENKESLVLPLAGRGARFTSLVHPLAHVDPSVKIGQGCVVGPWSILNFGVRLGDFCNVYPMAYLGEDVQCEPCCTLFARCTILEGSRIARGSGVWTGAMMPPRTNVGEGATIGMGSVVLKDVPPGATVMGNPARVVFTREQ